MECEGWVVKETRPLESYWYVLFRFPCSSPWSHSELTPLASRQAERRGWGGGVCEVGGRGGGGEYVGNLEAETYEDEANPRLRGTRLPFST